MEGVVVVPSVVAWGVGVVFVAFVGWAIRDRTKIGETIDDLRDRLTRVETKVNGGTRHE